MSSQATALPMHLSIFESVTVDEGSNWNVDQISLSNDIGQQLNQNVDEISLLNTTD
jgi:hypothetical protein